MNEHEGLLTEAPLPIECVEGLTEKVLALVEAVTPTVDLDSLHPSINSITSVFIPEDGVVIQITQGYLLSSHEKQEVEPSGYNIKLAVYEDEIDYEAEFMDENAQHGNGVSSWVRDYMLTADCELTLSYSSIVTPNHMEIYDGQHRISRVSLEDVDYSTEGVEYAFEYGQPQDNPEELDADEDEVEVVAAYSKETADSFDNQVSTHQAHYLISLLEKLVLDNTTDSL